MDNVEINDNYGYESYEYLNDVILKTLEHEEALGSIFSIIFVGEKEIQEMNLQYRGIDKVTDVISFAFEDSANVVAPSLRVLGDIYVCIPRMREQALLYGHSEVRELSFLVVHGMLHLLGYDHQTKEEEMIMFGLQEEILESLSILR